MKLMLLLMMRPMKIAAVVVVWLCLCSVVGVMAQEKSGVFKKNRLQEMIMREGLIHDVEQESLAAKAPTGLLGAKWLMSMANVKELRPECTQEGDDKLVEIAEVFGRAAMVTYHFNSDALLAVLISYFDGEPTKQGYLKMQKKLEAEYGPMPAPAAGPKKGSILESRKDIGRIAVTHFLMTINGERYERIMFHRMPGEKK